MISATSSARSSIRRDRAAHQPSDDQLYLCLHCTHDPPLWWFSINYASHPLPGPGRRKRQTLSRTQQQAGGAAPEQVVAPVSAFSGGYTLTGVPTSSAPADPHCRGTQQFCEATRDDVCTTAPRRFTVLRPKKAKDHPADTTHPFQRASRGRQ